MKKLAVSLDKPSFIWRPATLAIGSVFRFLRQAPPHLRQNRRSTGSPREMDMTGVSRGTKSRRDGASFPPVTLIANQPDSS
jgi:hypothetical protein